MAVTRLVNPERLAELEAGIVVADRRRSGRPL
jgi:hypothetical protein